MTEEDFFTLYREKFVPVYADFVALCTTKPRQILIEQENILSHLSQYKNQRLDSNTREENLIKANNHLVRVTLDMHKLVWAELRERLEPCALDGKKRLAFNAADDSVLKMFGEFMEQARAARHFEMNNVGNNPLDAIEKYEAANRTGHSLFQRLDTVKAARITRWTRIFSSRDFLIGVGASLAASLIVYLISM